MGADLLVSGVRRMRGRRGHKEIADNQNAAATVRSGIFDLAARERAEQVDSFIADLPAASYPR